MTRIRFEGLRSPALSALARSPVVAARLHRDLPMRTCRFRGCPSVARVQYSGGSAQNCEAGDGHAGRVMRLLRDPAVTRVLAVAVVVGLIAASAPVLWPIVRWVIDLL